MLQAGAFWCAMLAMSHCCLASPMRALPCKLPAQSRDARCCPAKLRGEAKLRLNHAVLKPPSQDRHMTRLSFAIFLTSPSRCMHMLRLVTPAGRRRSKVDQMPPLSLQSTQTRAQRTAQAAPPPGPPAAAGGPSRAPVTSPPGQGSAGVRPQQPAWQPRTRPPPHAPLWPASSAAVSASLSAAAANLVGQPAGDDVLEEGQVGADVER